MKILVFAHQLEVGGTQTNAIELSSALRDLHGHDVALVAAPGPMVELIRKRRLPFVPAPDTRVYPSLARMRVLREIVRVHRPDVVHAWDWFQCLDAYYGVHVPMRVPLVVTDMCMSLNRLLPVSLPTTFGTPQLVDEARASGRRRAELLLPPVDVHLNAPGVVDAPAFRRRHHINRDDFLLVTVSRFDQSMKAESLRRTIDVVRTLGRDLPLRLALVGDGTIRDELQRRADQANAELRRKAVVLTGALLDPRPAYAAADLVVGMGGSALRAMAFAKPVVVVGANGFSAPFTPETAQTFYYQGMYGVARGEDSDTKLATDIAGLLAHRKSLSGLGTFARQFVQQHFAIEEGSARLSRFCRAAAEQMPQLLVALADGIRTGAVWLRERRFVPGLKAFVEWPTADSAAPTHS
jgi:glycosyltransferase involved in cell wall biosynthesis